MARKLRNANNQEATPAAPEVTPPWPIPASWAWATVQRVGSVRLGRQRSPDTVSAAYPTKYLRASNIGPSGLDLTEVLEMDFDPIEREIYSLHAGDVVLAEASGSSAHVGRAAIWSDEIPGCCYQNHLIRFRPHAVTPGYALLVFQHLALTGAFASTARGVGIQHLGTSRFMTMLFPLPPFAEQDRIAAAATTQLQGTSEARTSIESALNRNTQQDNTILEAAALGGLIDPTGAPPIALPNEANTPAAQPSLFPSPDQATGNAPSPDFADLLGRALPNGWRWVRVDQAGEVRLGRQRSPKHEYGEHLHPYLRVANVFEDRIDTSHIRSMNFTPEEQKVYRLIPGDILLNEGQSPELVGRPAMYTGDPGRIFFQNTLIRFRAAEFVNSRYALLVFRHYLRSGQFTRAARWSTNIAHLGAARFGSMPFPLPPRADQDRIVDEAYSRLNASKAQRISIESSLHRLESMRRGIIRDAVSGKLVPQELSDEPARELLARLGAPPRPTIEAKRKERRMPSRITNREKPIQPLYDTIVKMGAPVRAEDLFEAAGYDRDSPADVEAFYLALRGEFGVRIGEVTGGTELRLEVISDASR